MMAASSIRRLRGFERGWGAELPPESRLVVRTYEIESGEEAARSLIASPVRPDAIFAASDELAVGLIRGVRRHGLEPGRDFHIVGFDKQQLALSLEGGPLTTVEVPRLQMAVRGCELLAERLTDIDQPVRRVFLGCSLYEGKTTGRC